ncbi:uncharacterized protein MELLADRAFT_72321 [Melampsora larici-populina 98AG31]|uniref:Uncharacterized protein n=1 Tax=Melampsora larici-populina (strain 98AG31 / pathotype 3-4-7) TaxID=747676 RepID=F4RSF2_MELLP|nr:uncharacterized protein MELLADRAFT_72321 [Melampsora larici-populina 98AG31]EGG04587.1 hypothetical protein MELLADRAFT_72321 [Melampsora larici-populina 98AG31]
MVDLILPVAVSHATAGLRYAARVLILPRTDMPPILNSSHLILQLVQTRFPPRIRLAKGCPSHLQLEDNFAS